MILETTYETKEIRKEINAQNNPFFMWMNEKLSEIENYKNTRAEIVKGQFFSEFAFVVLSQSYKRGKKRSEFIWVHIYKIEFRDLHFGRLLTSWKIRFYRAFKLRREDYKCN